MNSYKEEIIESVKEKIDCNNCNKDIDCVICIFSVVDEVMRDYI